MSVKDKLKDVGNFFKHLGQKIHDGLVAIFGQDALDNVEAQIKTILTDDARVVFVDAIQLASTLKVGAADASGAEKRSAAFSQIKSDLEKNGVSLADSAINLGIELVLGLLKAKTPA